MLKLENLEQCAREAFAEFLDLEDFELINRNIGSKKIYAPLYDAFKRHAVINAGYVNNLYDSAYMRTFYSAGEISAAKERWLGEGRA